MNCSGNCDCKANITMIKNGKESKIEGCSNESSLLEVALENGIEMDHACGGNGACTTCMVKVIDGGENLTEITEREEMMGMSAEYPEYRLGCQCCANGDITVELMY